MTVQHKKLNGVLAIDVETYSEIDITKAGAYRYCTDNSFEILLFAYAFDDEPVQIIDLTVEKMPIRVIEALKNPQILKTAFNANFERNAISNFLKIECPPNQWDCTMIRALRLGLPGSLDMAGKVLKFDEDKQKMKEGKALIQYFCKPCKPTKSNGGRTRNLPCHSEEKWGIFKEYCKRDVEVERDIRKKLERYIVLDSEKELWDLDQEINDRGVAVDSDLIEMAIKCDEEFAEKNRVKAVRLTGLNNPNSPKQIKDWVGDRLGHEVTSLTKDNIPLLMREAEEVGAGEVIEMLKLRQLMGKTSVKKYQAMKEAVCQDGRVHGLLQFYGANRTGRWAGRLVQVQNLPQNHLDDLDDARNFLRNGDFEALELIYDSVSDTLSQLIRTAFIPSEGNIFIVADFSAIEARVIAWMAKEQWRMNVFKDNGDIYCASASRMFGVPVEKHGVNGHLRQKGKIAELALGYGGAGGAIRAFDKDCSIPDEELPKLVSDWRAASPNIVNFWWDVDKAAKKAIREKTTEILPKYHLKFIYNSGVLFIELPSGRRLSYIRPKIEPNSWGAMIITYEGMEQTKHNWSRLETYGPKLVENIIQATARDCLGITMQRIAKKGYNIVFHVHDELILDVPKDFGSLEEVNKTFGEPIPWAPGLILNADGYLCNYYMKD